MKIVNNTHYFSINNKTYNIVPETDSWQFESAKRLSYSQRLYWEYKYIKSCGGQAFFYTFTYNNKSLPHFDYDFYDFDKDEVRPRSVPCFNYDHIRLLTNGIISKVLRRKYGSQLRYFVACERGEGKGFRGKGMNPHYHVIFFISPLSDIVRKPKDVPYKRISPISFCHLCKCVWQYDSSPGKYDHIVADYKSAKFGHCQPGDDLGLISDFDALSYVSKYVVKDTQQTFDDKSIKQYFVRKFKALGYTWHSLYSFYYYLRSDSSILSRQDFLDYSGISDFFLWRSCINSKVPYWRWLDFHPEFDSFRSDFADYFNRLYLPAIVDRSYRDYFNQFGSKVRCSKSLGVYGLNFVNDVVSNPNFVINKSDEVVSQPVCLYYYRKLYMNVVRCPQTGNPLYVLNDLGIDLKCRQLRSNLDKLCKSVYESFEFVNSNKDVFEVISRLSSHSFSLSDVFNLFRSSSFDDIVNRFCVYRFIYQYRSYEVQDPPFLSKGFTFDNFSADYFSFLRSNFYSCDYSELYLIKWIEFNHSSSFVSFDSHPVFYPFITQFKLIESVLSLFCDYVSQIKKIRFDSSTELRQKINAVKYSCVNP